MWFATLLALFWRCLVSSLVPMSLWLPLGLISCLAEPITVTVIVTVVPVMCSGSTLSYRAVAFILHRLYVQFCGHEVFMSTVQPAQSLSVCVSGRHCFSAEGVVQGHRARAIQHSTLSCNLSRNFFGMCELHRNMF